MYVHLILFVFQVQSIISGVRGNEEDVQDVQYFFTNVLQCIESLQREVSHTCGQERLFSVLEDHT